MQFNSFNDFITMGGYGFYVWLSYGVAITLLIILIFSSLNSHKIVKKRILQKRKRDEKLKAAQKATEQQVQKQE